jgi:hypothetical protein
MKGLGALRSRFVPGSGGFDALESRLMHGRGLADGFLLGRAALDRIGGRGRLVGIVLAGGALTALATLAFSTAAAATPAPASLSIGVFRAGNGFVHRARFQARRLIHGLGLRRFRSRTRRTVLRLRIAACFTAALSASFATGFTTRFTTSFTTCFAARFTTTLSIASPFARRSLLL